MLIEHDKLWDLVSSNDTGKNLQVGESVKVRCSLAQAERTIRLVQKLALEPLDLHLFDVEVLGGQLVRVTRTY